MSDSVNSLSAHGKLITVSHVYLDTPPLLVKGSRDPSVRSEGHADSRCVQLH